MKVKEVREKTLEELVQNLSEVREKLFSLKFKKVAGQLENTGSIKNLRRDIARIKTLIREKELNLNKRTEK